jgi:succinylglutamate desuccinylase
LSLEKKINEFDQIISKFITQGKAKEIGPDIWLCNSKKPKHLLSILVHGNETFGLDLAIDFLNNDPSQSFMLMLGNRESYLAQKRFVERDLNRSFGLNIQNLSEEKRAAEIEKYIQDIQYVLDLHQTSYRCVTPFSISRDLDKTLNLVNFLCPEYPLVYFDPTQKTSQEGMTFGEYCQENGKIFLTIELGEKGFQKELQKKGLGIIKNFLKFTQEIKTEPKIEYIYIPTQTVLKKEQTDSLVPGLENFSFIKKGSLLIENSIREDKIASEDGFVLFPKYGEYQKFSLELCKILMKRKLQLLN